MNPTPGSAWGYCFRALGGAPRAFGGGGVYLEEGLEALRPAGWKAGKLKTAAPFEGQVFLGCRPQSSRLPARDRPTHVLYLPYEPDRTRITCESLAWKLIINSNNSKEG
jgi:hypothetical protein